MDKMNEYTSKESEDHKKKIIVTVSREYNGCMQRMLRQTGKQNETGKSEIITKMVVQFHDGLQADIKLVSSDPDAKPWTEGVLFTKDGSELCCTDVSDDILGEYLFHVDDVEYTVLVQVEDLEEPFKNLSHNFNSFFESYFDTEERCQCDEGVPDTCQICQAANVFSSLKGFVKNLPVISKQAAQAKYEIEKCIFHQEDSYGNADESLCEGRVAAAEIVGAIEDIAKQAQL